jgi:anthranilate/para-aminobenzoate synthase component I
LPFWGGAVGWLAYDLGRQFERIDGTAQDDLGMPDIHSFAF